MATRKIVNLTTLLLAGLVDVHNETVASRRRAGSCLHEDLPDEDSELVTAPVATTTATANTRLNELKTLWNAHIASTAKHKAADATNGASSPNATNEATGITLANELKTDFNAHHASTTYHHVGGVGGVAAPANVATADASNEATLVALANALVDAYHRHISSGAPTIELVAS